MLPTTRPYRMPDLGPILRLWDHTSPLSIGTDPPVEHAVDLMGSDAAVTLVAEDETGTILGFAIGERAALVGWICKLAVTGEPPADTSTTEITSVLLREMETRLAEAGVVRLATLGDADGERRRAAEEQGYAHSGGRALLERELPASLTLPSTVAELGGQCVRPGMWDELRGMDEAKRLVERRVVLPLDQPDLATRHSVAPPSAIMLFGPPGTGKTTFAKGLASRLEWTFVEIAPGELASEGPDRQAQRLVEKFDRVLTLDSAVVFVDEVEELASVRTTKRKVGPSITNEFLKQIPRLRESARHILVCATNAVTELDPAVLRPGRFSYVLPVGPPDERARTEIWVRYVDDITDEDIDIAALVRASERFTAADIEFAARKAAQTAFEREHFSDAEHRATTDDFLEAVDAIKPTVTEEDLQTFLAESERFTRL